MTNIPDFIKKWRDIGGKERQNYQLFLIDLTRALSLPEPAPANDDDRDNPYIFERDVVFQHGRGETSPGRIDLYRRGAFVCVAKKIRAGTSRNAFDVALLNARSQAERYVRALSSDEGRPPFLIVVDIGQTIELYSEFSRTGGSYIEFPDPRSYSIKLEQLANPEIAERLRQVWLDPLSLDPAKRSAKVTREIADTLAKLAKSLEEAGRDPTVVAQFLMRCLFTMFSEDVGLLPKASPEADYVVGNPPFIGAANVRRALGDGYADALRASWKQVPESADFVMHWWDRAAELVRLGKLQRFGLITTNSLRQTFNRRVIERHLQAKPALSLSFAIADHPWVDSSDGAAVRIAMSCGVAGDAIGLLQTVLVERETGDGEISVSLASRVGRINADLTAGSDVTGAKSLDANASISSPGVKLHGAGFIVTDEEAKSLGLGQVKGMAQHVRDYRNGRDLTDKPRGVKVLDMFGVTADELRTNFPAIYQWLHARVKPERDSNNRACYRDNWWFFGEPRRDWRNMAHGLPRCIATVETAKHRTFQFLDASILPDNMIVAIATARADKLAILSARIHVTWALAAGGTLEDRPRYNKTCCFETFPFPALASPILGESEQPNNPLVEKLCSLGEQLDAHRKRQQAAHAGLTLTGMYNVLEKLKSAEPLTDKEKIIHEQGLVSVLKSLHDEIDLAVLEAYGWGDLAGLMQVVNGNDQNAGLDRSEAIRQLDETLLERLVALNKDRAAEEARGLIRYLRPEFQNPALAAAAPKQAEMDVESEDDAPAAKPINKEKIAWPKTLPEQVRAVLDVLKTDGAHNSVELVNRFKGVKAAKLGELLQTLVDMGRIRETNKGFSA